MFTWLLLSKFEVLVSTDNPQLRMASAVNSTLRCTSLAITQASTLHKNSVSDSTSRHRSCSLKLAFWEKKNHDCPTKSRWLSIYILQPLPHISWGNKRMITATMIRRFTPSQSTLYLQTKHQPEPHGRPMDDKAPFQEPRKIFRMGSQRV
jgi:hypothetical protein